MNPVLIALINMTFPACMTGPHAVTCKAMHSKIQKKICLLPPLLPPCLLLPNIQWLPSHPFKIGFSRHNIAVLLVYTVLYHSTIYYYVHHFVHKSRLRPMDDVNKT